MKDSDPKKRLKGDDEEAHGMRSCKSYETANGPGNVYPVARKTEGGPPEWKRRIRDFNRDERSPRRERYNPDRGFAHCKHDGGEQGKYTEEIDRECRYSRQGQSEYSYRSAKGHKPHGCPYRAEGDCLET